MARDKEKQRECVNKYYRKTQGAPNTGKPWTEAEIRLIRCGMYSNVEIARVVGRSYKAVEVMKYKLKKEGLLYED